MENRSHALIAGLFTVLLLLAGVLVVLWLSRDDVDLVPYDLVTVDSVQGLTPQADVRYRGLLVGKVDTIGFDPAGSGAMLIRIGVQEGTPMTDTLKATVEMKGVTGVAYIDLDDDGQPGRPLGSTPQKVARIHMQPGLAERLMNRAGELMDRLQRAGDQVVAILGPENQIALNRALENTADATAQVNSLLQRLGPVVDEAVPMMQGFRDTARNANVAVQQWAGVAAEARSTLQSLSGPGGLLAEASQSVAQIRQATASLASVVPQFGQAAGSVSEAAQSASRAAQQLQRAPQSVLFGPAPARPGPGEAGFAGFSQP
jgi:phospholipid/cholesterol/gamma-HCH transport system substrate-binding protein